MKFSYMALDGEERSASFDDLEIIFDGHVALEGGWFIDRVNRIKSSGCYLEFRSGQENPPGVVPSAAIEISPERAQSIVREFAANKALKSLTPFAGTGEAGPLA